MMKAPYDPKRVADTVPSTTTHGPIFITGLSKSGKTELRRVLERHPGVTMERHTRLWHTVSGRFGDLSDHRTLGRCLDTIESSQEAQPLGFDRAAIEAEFKEGPLSTFRLLALVHAQHAARHGAVTWGVQSRGIEHRTEGLMLDIPDVKLIHMVRDPRVRAARTQTGRRIVGGAGWETAKWLDSAKLAIAGVERWPSQYLVVRCEDLAAAPAQVVKEVLEFAGLDGDPAVDAVIGTIDWRVLGPVQVEGRLAAYVDRAVGPDLVALGYPAAETDDRSLGWLEGWLGFRLSRAVGRRHRHATRRRR